LASCSLSNHSEVPPNQPSTTRGDPSYDRRAQDIRYDLASFERTGQYGFLCHAAMLGSEEAALRLKREGLSCQY
jgi:hypothetical protein